MLEQLKEIKPMNIREWLDKKLVQGTIGLKHVSGLGSWLGSNEKPLSSDLAKELHKPIIKQFQRRKVISNGIDQIWASDLIDMQKYS